MRSYFLFVLCFFVLLLDFYCYKAIIASFKNWSVKVKRNFGVIWFAFSILLIIGVFAAIFLNLFLSLRAVILVAFFLSVVAKVFMLPFLLVDDIRRLAIKLFT